MSLSNEVEGRKLTGALTNFALGLFKDLSAAQGGGNVFFSPFSISLALTMTHLGARNETANQMSEVLGFADVCPDQLHSLFSELRQNLTSGGNCTLDIANKLYLQKEYNILQDFLGTTKKFYDATAENVDFTKNGEETGMAINEWVKEKTKGKILHLLKPGTIDPFTRLILVNSIYFKSDWKVKFSPNLTRDADFHLADGSSVQVPMMHVKQKFYYGVSEEFGKTQALELPYAGGSLSFVVLLPEQIDGVNELEKNIMVHHINNYRETFTMEQVDVMVYLPRFKLEDSFDLGDTLANQGMKDLFTERADLSGIDGTRNLFVSQVIHKSFLEVNEEGSEASAATSVVTKKKKKKVIQDVCYLRADHPFLFFISDAETGALVFLGRFANP